MSRSSLPLLLLLISCARPETPASPRSDAVVAPIPGLLAVDWVDGTTKAQFDEAEKAFGIDVELNSPFAADEALTIASGVEVTDELLGRLRNHPLVEHAEPVYEYSATFVPNDPQYPLQWHMQLVGAPSAWEWATGADVVVAVIDTGVSRVDDFADTRFVPGWDFVHDDDDASDDHGHGTHVAGTIAQSTHNGAGVSGLAHRAAIMPLKVLSQYGGGTTVDIADAIRWAVDHGAKVVNLSLGGGARSDVLESAIRKAVAKGVVVVAAAGNGFGSPVSYPAAYEGVIGVSAVRFDRTLAPYSSFGPEVDLAAPGGDRSVDQNGDGHPDGVLQQVLSGRFEWFQGTSMAAPHVAGAAALLASAGVTDAGAIERILKETATPAGDPQRYGAGVLDAGRAVRAVRLWGGLWRLALALALTWLSAWVVRRNGERVRPLGLLGVVALVLASSGFVAFGIVGLGHPAWAAALVAPLPEWGQVLHGARASSPLWLSALGPLFFFGLSRWKPLAGLAAGFCLGWAAYLLHMAVVGWVDVRWVPGRALEALWLVLNGLLAFALGTMAQRSVARHGRFE